MRILIVDPVTPRPSFSRILRVLPIFGMKRDLHPKARPNSSKESLLGRKRITSTKTDQESLAGHVDILA
jgi:hypothetical protein